MRFAKTAVTTILVAMMLVIGTDYVSLAATGHSLVLGKVNKAKKTTTIKSSKGAALSLKTKSSQPPLKVNSDEVVKNLNADLLDGKSASQLGVRTRVERFTMSGTAVEDVQHVITDVKAGTYLLNYTLWFDRSNNTAGYCYVFNADNDYSGYGAVAGRPAGNGDFPVSGTGVLKFDTTQDLTLRCSFEDPVDVTTYDAVTFALTPIDSQTGSALPRLTPRRGALAPGD